MKDLTYDELQKAPHLIQCIYISSIYKNPIGYSIFEEAKKNHPEYFPDEIERDRKWALIPKEVHDAYKSELHKLLDNREKSPSEGRGLVWLIEHPDEMEEYHKWYEANSKQWKQQETDIWNKYYTEFGLSK